MYIFLCYLMIYLIFLLRLIVIKIETFIWNSINTKTTTMNMFIFVIIITISLIGLIICSYKYRKTIQFKNEQYNISPRICDILRNKFVKQWIDEELYNREKSPNNYCYREFEIIKNGWLMNKENNKLYSETLENYIYRKCIDDICDVQL